MKCFLKNGHAKNITLTNAVKINEANHKFAFTSNTYNK